MSWFACDTALLHDRKVMQLGEEYGPAGPLAWVWLLGYTKERGRAGRVDIAYRQLVSGAFLESTDTARAILHDMKDYGLIEAEDVTEALCTVTVCKWQKYQRDAKNAMRQERHREKQRAGVLRERDKPSPTGTRTGTGTRTAKDVTVTKDGEELSLVQSDPVLQAVMGRFRAVAESRNGNRLNVDAKRIAQALSDFSHLPRLQAEAIECAEWLGSEKGKQRKDGPRTLRKWLRNVEERTKEAPSERPKRFTRPEHVSH